MSASCSYLLIARSQFDSTYKPFLDRFGNIAHLDKAQMYHANLTPHPASQVLSDVNTPACETLVVYFPSGYSQADQDKFEEDMKKFVKVVEDNADTYTGSAGGWIKEELPIPGTEDKGKAYAAFIGWTSVQGHLDFRETQPFKDNVHLLRGAKDLKKLTVIHTSGTEVQPGAGGIGDMSGGALPSAQGEVLNPQGGSKVAPKARSDGTTVKNNDDLKGAANSTKNERQGRPGNSDAFS